MTTCKEILSVNLFFFAKVHDILMAAKKAANEGKVEGMESIITQLIGLSKTLDEMSKVCCGNAFMK